MEIEDDDKPEIPSAAKLANNLRIEKSGVELDFDIFQRHDSRQLTDVDYYSLTNDIASLIVSTLDIQPNLRGMTDDRFLYTYAVILRKPAVVFVKHKDYGECYKDSFHLRFPGIKVSKVYKQYLMKRIHNEGILQRCLRSITTLLNPMEDVLDPMSAVFPPMLLGSMKRNGKVPHEFYLLFSLQIPIDSPTPMVLINIDRSFDPVNPEGDFIKITDPTRKGNAKITVRAAPKYKYNLTHEVSLLYEAPKGLIKKREFDAKPSLQHELRLFAERHATHGEFDNNQIVQDEEINAVNDSVATICNRNFEAAYLRELLDILSPNRTSEYQTWKKIIYMLAWANPDYKPLAVYFSMRNPSSWIKQGFEHLSDNWEWALNHKPQKDSSDFNSIKILNAWAKADNPDEYRRVQIHNTRAILSKRANIDGGDLTEQSMAEILFSMFSGKFISDADSSAISRRAVRKWYEFVYPEDEDEYGYEYGHAYKWRIEDGNPDNLDKYICKKMPLYIDSHIQYNDELINKITLDITEAAASENATQTTIDQLTRRKAHYEYVNKNLRKTKRKLGTPGFIRGVISRCEIEFRRRGFDIALDQNENYIGVGNGVLQLFPHVELIQRYHEIPISRYTKADYIPYDENNPIIKETEEALKRLFVTPEGVFDEETYTFVMMYLSTSLHGRKKKALFMMFIGEGSAGKTTLAELQINTLGTINNKHPGFGYGNSVDTKFFTDPRKGGGGPDTEKVSIKHARYVYSEETSDGDPLYMDQIKKLTGGGTVSGNDKNEKHETFVPKCVWAFISNFKPTIKGSDYAAWRRLLLVVCRRRFMPPEKYDPSNPLHYPEDPKWQEDAPNNPVYLSAYLSILVKFHERLQAEYNGDIKSVPKKRIDEDTKRYQNEQDIYSRFVSERAVHIGKTYPGTNRKPDRITLDEVTQKFRKWFASNLDNNVPRAQEIHTHIKETILSKYTSPHTDEWIIEEHFILNPGDIFDLDEVIEKIKRDEAVNDIHSDDDSQSCDSDNGGGATENNLHANSASDDGSIDNFDLPDDLSDLENAFEDDLSNDDGDDCDDLHSQIYDDLEDDFD